jgi:hypothetical protein
MSMTNARVWTPHRIQGGIREIFARRLVFRSSARPGARRGCSGWGMPTSRLQKYPSRRRIRRGRRGRPRRRRSWSRSNPYHKCEKLGHGQEGLHCFNGDRLITLGRCKPTATTVPASNHGKSESKHDGTVRLLYWMRTDRSPQVVARSRRSRMSPFPALPAIGRH